LISGKVKPQKKSEFSNSRSSSNKKIDYSVQRDTIVYDTVYFPKGEKYEGKILSTGSFHKNEVSPFAANEIWFGLFKNGKNLCCRN
jgi:hypothetical protein